MRVLDIVNKFITTFFHKRGLLPFILHVDLRINWDRIIANYLGFFNNQSKSINKSIFFSLPYI